MIKRILLSTILLLAFTATPSFAQPADPPTGDQPTGDQPTGDQPTGDQPTREEPPAAQPAPPPDPEPDPKPKTDPDADGESEEVPELSDDEKKRLSQGRCETPRQAWMQFLYWQFSAGGDTDRRAAACFDTSNLAVAGDAPKYARRFLAVLDNRNAFIHPELIPDDPDYVDDKGKSVFLDPVANDKLGGGIEVEKRGDRWLFTPNALDRVNSLYKDAGLAGWVETYLPTWAQTTVLGVEAWKYIAVLLLIFLAITLQKFAVFVIGRYAKKLVAGGNLKFLERAVSRADRPIGGLVMAGVFYVGFPMLLFPIRTQRLAMVATKALAAYSVVWLGYRLIDVLTQFWAGKAEETDSKLDDQLVPLIGKTLKVFVSLIGAIFIMQNLDVNVGSLLAGLGLGGLAFALAAKDTIANFFGSLMIFIDKPFQIGDWVVIANTEGIVEEVGFRTSRVRTFYNSLVTVPNQLVTNAIVDNYGEREFRRYVTTLSLCYDTPPDKVDAFCEGVRAIIRANEDMRHDYYIVEFKEFGAAGLDVMVYCFMVARDWNHELRTRHNLNLEIIRLAARLGVGFAFPTQTIHVETQAKPGESRPSHGGPETPDQLKEIIEGFAPGGAFGTPKGKSFTQGYDCGVEGITSKGGSSGDG
jgi:MscS family membrane protein